MDYAKTTVKRDKKHLTCGIWCTIYKRYDGIWKGNLHVLVLSAEGIRCKYHEVDRNKWYKAFVEQWNNNIHICFGVVQHSHWGGGGSFRCLILFLPHTQKIVNFWRTEYSLLACASPRCGRLRWKLFLQAVTNANVCLPPNILWVANGCCNWLWCTVECR